MTITEAIKAAKAAGAWREYGDCTPHPTRFQLGDGSSLYQNEDASDCWIWGDAE